MSESFRKESRKDWHVTGDTQPLDQQLQTGCLQRIADATELMAKRYSDLIADKERAESRRDSWHREADRLVRSNNALRGQITKLKKQLQAAKD